MTTQNSNPFVLPGLGQSGDMAQHPLMASMEMMRQAWQTLAGSGALTQPVVASPLGTEELDRRIADLRAVENWLRVNMSMLSSSIQALEVQRATIATLRNFVNTPGVDAPGDNPSPLEVALGIKPSGQARIRPAAEGQAAEGGQGAAPPLPDAAQNWWGMLQKQFDTLAAATAATMQGAQMPSAAQSSGTPAKPKPSRAKAQDGDAPAPAKSAGAPRKRAPAARKRRAS